VKVILSESAEKFVAPLTFQALSRHEVYIDTFDEKNPRVIAHIDLADWADLILVAPATANTLAKIACGIADNMITTTLLAATSPVWIAPAMNVHMYDHPAMKKNLSLLAEYGYQFIEPSEGYLACGYIGKGRLEEPEKIVELVKQFFTDDQQKPLQGKTVVVTAGPTREKIDPVQLSAPSGIELVNVESADEMYHAVLNYFDQVDVVIKTAAVADYRPNITYDHKVKKQAGDSSIELERTKDILLELGKRKKKQVLIGFAAETENVEEYARKKLSSKNADMIVANNVKTEGAGFGTDTNIVTLFKKSGSVTEVPLMSKSAVAKKIIEEVTSLLKDMDNNGNS
jgi:phosphopantothenoylcysteine decarboxylase/phosphopantothenate--cysteine ligase